MIVGIGFFIVFIGFINSGIVVIDFGFKFLKFGDFIFVFKFLINDLNINLVIIFLCGVIVVFIGFLIIGILIVKRVKGVIIIGIIIVIVISFFLKIVDLLKFKFLLELFKVFVFNFDFVGLFVVYG